MKVIKQGIIPSERIWRGTCQQCRSEIEAKESEMTHMCEAGKSDTGYGGVLFYRVSQ